MELILKGQVFRKAGVKTSVFTLHQVSPRTLTAPSHPPMAASLLSPPPQPGDAGDVESAQQFSPNYLVELSAFASSGQDRSSDELRTFAENLKPYPHNTELSRHIGTTDIPL